MLNLCWCSCFGMSAKFSKALAVLSPFLAAADVFEPPVIEGQTSKLFGMNVRDVVLLGGMALVFALTLFLWAYLTRKKGRQTIALAHSRAVYRSEPRERDRDEDEEETERRRYRKKRRRRQHPELLPRNPTLQETGGLPPLRPEEPPAEPTQ